VNRIVWLLALSAVFGCVGAAGNGYAGASIANVRFTPGPSPRAARATTLSVTVDGISRHQSLSDANCFCELRVQRITRTGGDATTRVRSQLIAHSSAVEFRGVVRFPSPGNYLIRVSGSPKYLGSFDPFVASRTIVVR